jgi:hypothetical protein
VHQCTRVTGEQWLRHTFDRAMRLSRPPYEELRTELRVLAGSGALSADEASRALARLDRDELARSRIVRRRTERAFSENIGAAASQDRLEALLTPARSLGEVDGIAVRVMLVELWTSRLILRLEALQNQLTDALDATFDTASKAYERRWVEHRAAAEAEDLSPPEQPSVSRLGELPLSVVDDLDTRYHAIGTATGGSEHPWRSEWRLEPGVPSSASVVRIALEDGETDRECVEIALPSRI